MASNTLAPGYGMGWLVPGRFRDKIIQMKFAGNLLSGGIFQHAVADYMQSGNFNRHLRNLRSKLLSRMERGLSLIERHFPAGCKVTKPSGGFMCWIEGPPGFDQSPPVVAHWHAAWACRPARFFPFVKLSAHCIALNLSFPWTPDAEARLKAIGEAVREQAVDDASSRRRGAAPQLCGRKLGTLGERLELCPHDRGMNTAIEDALGDPAVG